MHLLRDLCPDNSALRIFANELHEFVRLFFAPDLLIHMLHLQKTERGRNDNTPRCDVVGGGEQALRCLVRSVRVGVSIESCSDSEKGARQVLCCAYRQ